MTYIYCCQECSKLHEIDCCMDDMDLIKPRNGICECGGELKRGLQPIPHIGEKVKGKMNSKGGMWWGK